MAISLDKAFGIHQHALMLRARRAELLAANLANVDTPGFKARDVDFNSMLRSLSGTADNVTFETTHSRHLPLSGSGGSAFEPMYRVPTQASLDGNTVDSQLEQAAFMRNSLAYETSLSFLNGRIQGLRLAIRGE